VLTFFFPHRFGEGGQYNIKGVMDTRKGADVFQREHKKLCRYPDCCGDGAWGLHPIRTHITYSASNTSLALCVYAITAATAAVQHTGVYNNPLFHNVVLTIL